VWPFAHVLYGNLKRATGGTRTRDPRDHNPVL
jgi:hypothetical protein